MFIIGHIGITIGIFAFLVYFKPELKQKIDLRLLAFGAVLPDLIDKTIGLFILQDSISSGRIYSHTLVFAILITYLAIVIASKYTYAVSFGIWTHIIFDRMWEAPETFLWPAYGWGFPSYDFYVGKWWEMLFTNPYTYVSEILGAIILIFLFLHLKIYKRDNWNRVFKDGTLPGK